MCNFRISHVVLFPLIMLSFHSEAVFAQNVLKGDFKILGVGIAVSSTTEYRNATEPQKDLIRKELSRFQQETNYATFYISKRDPVCLSDQFAYIRLQRPDWNYQTVKNRVLPLCVDAKKVETSASLRCKSTYPRKGDKFCQCYSSNFTGMFSKNPNDNQDYLTGIGVKAAYKCKQYSLEK